LFLIRDLSVESDFSLWGDRHFTLEEIDHIILRNKLVVKLEQSTKQLLSRAKELNKEEASTAPSSDADYDSNKNDSCSMMSGLSLLVEAHKRIRQKENEETNETCLIEPGQKSQLNKKERHAKIMKYKLKLYLRR
jgi:hypothetical protein